MNGKQEPLCFALPNGVKIMAQACGDADPAQSGNGWSSIDINAVYPKGSIEVLCCADYDAESGKLRIFAYDGKQEDMAYECGDFHFNNVEEDDQNG